MSSLSIAWLIPSQFLTLRAEETELCFTPSHRFITMGIYFFHQDHYEMRRMQLNLYNSSISFPFQGWKSKHGSFLYARTAAGQLSHPAVLNAKDRTTPHLNTSLWTTENQFHSCLGTRILCSVALAQPYPSFTPVKTYGKASTCQGDFIGTGYLELGSFNMSSDAFFCDLEKIIGSPLDCNSSSVMGGLLFYWHAKVLWGLIH